MRAFKKINSQDYEKNIIQDNVEQAISQVIDVPIITGNFLQEINLNSAIDNKIPHKLGIKPRFWMIARQNTNSNVWELEASTNDTFLVLKCSTSCKISLWVG